MIAKTIWEKELEFDGLSESGHYLVFDGDPAHGYGPSPMEAVLAGPLQLHLRRRRLDPAKEARASHQPHCIGNRGTGRCTTTRLYKDHADLPDWWRCFKEGRRSRSRTLEE